MLSGNSSDCDPAAVAQLSHVTKFFGDFKAVDDLSFSLVPGSICGFLGPNGAGKTTTIRMLLEILKPTRGRITMLGGPRPSRCATASAICPRKRASTRR